MDPMQVAEDKVQERPERHPHEVPEDQINTIRRLNTGIGGYSAFHPAYCATKGAVLAFTRSVAVEVAGGNIFVNAIAAGGILTPPMEKYLVGLAETERNAVHQLIPLGRMGRPEEYASLAVYLASDEHYLVGQTISPNGGMIL